MAGTPTISVIMPVFNRADVIAESIASLLKQEFQNWELIIVDDASTDETFVTAGKFAADDLRIKVFPRQGETKGANACRNQGLHRATGEYVIFLDSDDVLKPDCFTQRIKAIEGNSGLDLLVFPGAVFSDNPREPDVYWNIKNEASTLDRFFLFDGPWQTTGATWKRSFLLASSLAWDEHLFLWQDIDFHIQAVLKEPVYKIFWELPFDYLVKSSSPDSLSRVDYNNEKKIVSRIYFWKKYLKALGNTDQKCIEPSSLKLLLLNVLKIYAVQRKWKNFKTTINSALQYNVITRSEFRLIRRNAMLAALSRNMAKRFRFPSENVLNIFKHLTANTLQKIPVIAS